MALYEATKRGGAAVTGGAHAGRAAAAPGPHREIPGRVRTIRAQRRTDAEGFVADTG